MKTQTDPRQLPVEFLAQKLPLQRSRKPVPPLLVVCFFKGNVMFILSHATLIGWVVPTTLTMILHRLLRSMTLTVQPWGYVLVVLLGGKSLW